jgi:hypothetical protein
MPVFACFGGHPQTPSVPPAKFTKFTKFIGPPNAPAVERLMAAPLIFANHGTVRDAVWLWLWLWTYTKPLNAEWQPVSDGLAISDVQIAWNLDVSVETVRRWRRRLERFGFIRTELVRPRHRRFWLVKPAGPEQALLEAPVAASVN